MTSALSYHLCHDDCWLLARLAIAWIYAWFSLFVGRKRRRKNTGHWQPDKGCSPKPLNHAEGEIWTQNIGTSSKKFYHQLKITASWSLKYETFNSISIYVMACTTVSFWKRRPCSSTHKQILVSSAFTLLSHFVYDVVVVTATFAARPHIDNNHAPHYQQLEPSSYGAFDVFKNIWEPFKFWTPFI